MAHFAVTGRPLNGEFLLSNALLLPSDHFVFEGLCQLLLCHLLSLVLIFDVAYFVVSLPQVAFDLSDFVMAGNHRRVTPHNVVVFLLDNLLLVLNARCVAVELARQHLDLHSETVVVFGHYAGVLSKLIHLIMLTTTIGLQSGKKTTAVLNCQAFMFVSSVLGVQFVLNLRRIMFSTS